MTTSHALNEVNTSNTYRFYVQWDDSVNETMDNEDDTAATVDGVASVDINIQFIQTPSQSGGSGGSGS